MRANIKQCASKVKIQKRKMLFFHGVRGFRVLPWAVVDTNLTPNQTSVDRTLSPNRYRNGIVSCLDNNRYTGWRIIWRLIRKTSAVTKS